MLKKILTLALSLTLLAGCQADLNKGMGAATDLYTAGTISDADLTQMGQDAAKDYDSKHKVAGVKTAYGKRLEKLTKDLTAHDGLSLNYKVYMTEEINAFALPDGSIRVYSGLMDMLNDDELLFVIGHEIGHVKHGDSLNKFRLAYTASGARKAASASGGYVGAIADSALGDLTQAFLNAQYSQKNEYGADAYGLETLKFKNKDGKGAVSALRKIEALGSSSSSILSTHPDSGKRADRLEKMNKN